MRRRKRHSLVVGAALAITGLLICASTAAAACKSQSGRAVVKVAPYGGAVAGDAQNHLSRFIVVLGDKAKIWKEDFAELVPQAPFLAKFKLALDAAEVMKGQPITAEQAYRFWLQVPETLQVFTGAVFESEGRYSVQSSMHLGELVKKSTPTVLQFTLLVKNDETSTANDSHSLIIYYALGLEARELECPSSVIAALLSRANGKATDLLRGKLQENERQQVLQIKESIKTILSALK